jgi:hypothetical protein
MLGHHHQKRAEAEAQHAGDPADYCPTGEPISGRGQGEPDRDDSYAEKNDSRPAAGIFDGFSGMRSCGLESSGKLESVDSAAMMCPFWSNRRTGAIDRIPPRIFTCMPGGRGYAADKGRPTVGRALIEGRC